MTATGSDQAQTTLTAAPQAHGGAGFGGAGFLSVTRPQGGLDTVPTLDSGQMEVLRLPSGQSASVIGAPGTGKTVTLIEFVTDRIARGIVSVDEVLVLTPTRTAATALRDRLSLRVGVPTGGALARTANSLAFEIVRDAAAATGDDAPTLLTGGEQDQIIADLLAGDIEEGTGPVWPDPLTPDVRTLRGFRTELRNLMMRAVEYDVTPAALAEIGTRENRPEWVAAARFIAGYDEVKGHYRDHHFDSTELVQAATAIVEGSAPARNMAAGNMATGDSEPHARATPGTLVDRLRLVVLDDVQESPQSTLSLVRALARRGVTVIAFGDPDISTGSFRGARADAPGRLAHYLGLNSVPTLVLGETHRHDAGIRRVTADLSGRIGAASAGTQRQAGAALRAPTSAVETTMVGSAAEELAVIARRLRERHIFQQVPWDKMAVIVRSGSLVPGLARGLAALEVPTRTPAGADVLRDEYAVRGFIQALEIVYGRREFSAPAAQDLLLGPLGGLDPITLRRLKAALRHEELSHAAVGHAEVTPEESSQDESCQDGLRTSGYRSADELLVEAMVVPGALATLDTAVARRARRLADSIRTATEQAARGDTIEELLWGLWERSRLASSWRDQALGTGIIAEEANRNLDAVVALFAAATRFVERTPSAPGTVFLEQLIDTDVAEDSLAARAGLPSVTISTPTGTVGHEFDVVVIAGVQDGVWPNLRVRGSLLGAEALAAIVSGDAAEARTEGAAHPVDARRDVLHDELRMFTQAVSRARRDVFVTCVSDNDSTASPFFGLLPEPTDVSQRPPLTLRGLVGRLRRELTEAGDSQAAAASLARLAKEGVPGADPSEWYGLAEPTSTAPLVDLTEGEAVHVSPSKMESFATCPLHWLIGEIEGGSSSLASGLGSIIHDVAEHAVDTSPDALWRGVDARWNELAFETDWHSQAERGRARDMVGRLSSYLRDFENDGGRLLAAESAFELPIELGAGTALLRGTIDRVEQLGDDRIVIVDLKTGGRDPKTAEALAQHTQLGAYQLAFSSGVIPGVDEERVSGGAKLVIVSSGTKAKNYRDPAQQPFTDEEVTAFRDRVMTSASGMAGATFLAHVGAHCLDPWSFGRCRIHIVKEISA